MSSATAGGCTRNGCHIFGNIPLTTARFNLTRLLLLSQLRFLRRHPVGALASLVGVALAVLAVVAVHLVSVALGRTLESVPSAALGHSHVLTKAGLREQDYFDLRGRWRRDELPGVESLMPVVDRRASIAGKRYRVLGFDPLAGASRAAPAAAAGTGAPRFLVADVVLAAPDAVAALREAGIDAVPFEAAAADTLLADLPTAWRLLGRDGELDAVWLRMASARSRFLNSLDAALPGIVAALPRFADPQVAGFDATAARRWNPASRFADGIAFNLGALSLLAVLMAALLAIQASLAYAARQRRARERLLAMGVSRRRLRALGLAEGLAIGACGTGLGIALGALAAEGLLSAADGAAARPALDGWAVGKALTCGVAVAALGPVLAATAPKPARRRLRHAAGVVALAVAALALAQGTLLLAFAGLLALCCVQMTHGVPLAAALVARLGRFARTLRARANLRAAAARIGELRLAMGAFSVATATAIGMGLLVESLRDDFARMLDQRLWDGVYVQAQDIDEDWLRSLPGVGEVRRYGSVDARLARGPARIELADLDAAETARYGYAGALGARAMLSEVGARSFGLGVGDRVAITAPVAFDVEIGHIFRDFGAPAPRLLLPLAQARRFPAEAVDWRRVAVRADPAAVAELTGLLAARYGDLNVRNQTQIRELAMTVFDRTFIVSQLLAALVLAVAVIGLYAGLTALEASREREFRLLAAIGCGRADIQRMAIAQASALGALAALTAVPLGLAIAWVLCDLVHPLAFGWSIGLRFDMAAVGYPALLAILAAIIAGAVPAHRTLRGFP